jgi:hypothetical protein
MLTLALTVSAGLRLEAGQLAWGGLRAEWTDLSTWERPDEANREVEHGLGLVLQSETGLIKLAFLGRMSTREPSRRPTSIKVQVGTGTFGNPNDVRAPVLSFTADPGTDKMLKVDLGSRLTTDSAVGASVGNGIANGMATMPSGDLVKLSKAKALVGRVLGYDVEFREDQILALREYLTRLKL